MKKAIVFESNLYRCEMKAKELGYKPSECVLISATFSHDRQREMIREYWKDVLVDKTIKIYGISEKGFINLYQ